MTRLISCLVLLWASSSMALSNCQNWTPECVFNVKSIDTVEVAPDHLHTFYLVKKADLANGRWLSELYVANNYSHRVKRYAKKLIDLDHPAWSKRGDNIWFLAKGKKYQAVWKLHLPSKVLQKQFETSQNIDAFAVAPDEKTLAFTADITLKPEKNYPLAVRYGVQTPKGLWLTTLYKNTSPKLMTDSTKNVGVRDGGFISWSPDSRYLSFNYSINDINDSYAQSWVSHLAVLDTASKKMTDLVRDDSMNTKAMFSHQGRWIAYASNASAIARHDARQFFFNQICLVSLDGKQRKCLAETFDQRPTLLGWAADDQSIIVQEHRGVKNKLYRLPTNGAAPETILPAQTELNPTAFLDKTGQYLGFVNQQFSTPPEAFITALKPFKAIQISHVQPKITANLGQAKLIEWSTKEGKKIQGILITPSNHPSGKPLPLVLVLHGGPTNVWREEFLGSAESQAIPISFGMLANHGYAVLAPNIRGSIGYGPKFAMSNFKDLVGKDFQDAMEGVDYLIQQKIADPKRLAVWGWSYGGYLSAWSITQTPRFKAAIVGAGLTDIISFDGTSVLSQVYFSSYFDNYFWQDQSLYLKRSPIMFVNKITTPTLIQYGAEDHIVPLSQGAELFNALNVRKIPVAMYTFPGEGHSFSNPQMVAIALRQMLDWLNLYTRLKT